MNDIHHGFILVVDDNDDNRDLLSRRLEREGFRVLTAANGSSALRMCEEYDFDLVLLDLMMPDMSGIDVLKVLRRTRSALELPVIMVSADSQSESIVKALNNQANDYITKPIDFPVALARIKTHMRQKTSREGPLEKTVPVLEPGSLYRSYRIESVLGEGGMGIVYKAFDTRLNRYVAMKVIHYHIQRGSDAFHRFLREARAIASLSHPNIVTVYEISDEELVYYTMEYINGVTLCEFARLKRMSFDDIVVLSRKIASALEAVHELGIVHRDLKPSNIMVGKDGEPHLMDFGLAKLLHADMSITRTGEIMGTPAYMAPEQIDPSLGEVDLRTDIYAFGALMYELACHQPPFPGKNISSILYHVLCKTPPAPSSINPSCPPAFERIILRCLEKEKEKRYQNVSELKTDLHTINLKELSPEPESRERKYTVLIVEDNPMNRDMLARRLSRKGFIVYTANDGKEGVEKTKEILPDIILMDLDLPEIDGWEATRMIKSDEKTCSIPVIALTAHAMTGEKERAFEAGCDEYDTKPINFRRLLDKMYRILQQS